MGIMQCHFTTFLDARKVFLCLLISIFSAVPAHAEDDAIDLGEVVVRSERGAELDETAASTVIIPEKDTPLAETPIQVLEQAVGVHVRRYGGVDDFSALSLRGSSPTQVQIYLDDVPLITAQGSIADLGLIPLSALAGVEVYRGGSPGTLPESSIGGVVVFKSKPKPEKFEWTLDGGYGSFGTLKLGTMQTQAIGNASYLFAYEHFRSKGDFTYVDNNGTTFNTADDRIVRRQNNSFAQNALFSKVSYDHPAGWNISFIDSFLQKGQGIPGLGTRTSLTAHLDTWRNLSALTVTVPNLGTEVLTGKFNVFFDYLNSEFSDPNGDIGLGPQVNDDDTYRFGEMAKFIWRAGNHQRISGMVAHRGEYYVPHVSVGALLAGGRSRRHALNAGLEDEITLFDERLILVPSVRLENVFNHLADPTATTNTSRDHQISAKLGIKVRLVDQLYFKGNVYRGFRQPTFTELFGDRGVLIGNPQLAAEEALNFDAGLAYTMPETDWMTGGSVEATYFRNDISNLIQFLQTSQFTAKAFNLNNAVINGIEAVARATFVDRLTVAGNYTWQRAKDTSGTVTDGSFLPGRPVHELAAQLIWREQWMDELATSLTAEYRYMSDMYLDTQNLLKVTDRSIVTAGLSITLFDHVTTSFTARNITNDRTVDTIGYPLPGRSYWGSVTVKL